MNLVFRPNIYISDWKVYEHVDLHLGSSCRWSCLFIPHDLFTRQKPH